MFRTRIFGIALALAVGSLPVAPPEHVHEAEEHGHQHVLMHRHFAAHTNNHHQDGHDGVFDHDDGPMLTLDAIYTLPVAVTPLAPPPHVVISFIDPPAINLVFRHPDYVERLIHGPPRAPTGLRAPPLSFFL